MTIARHPIECRLEARTVLIATNGHVGRAAEALERFVMLLHNRVLRLVRFGIRSVPANGCLRLPTLVIFEKAQATEIGGRA